MNAHLMIIDPQNDFMDTANAALPVPGAIEDMRRVAALIDRVGRRLTDIHVTLDSHRVIDVAHPGMWMDAAGNSPAEYTVITAADIEKGIWTPRAPSLRKRMLAYARQLLGGNKYALMIWPEHCVIGTAGHNVQGDLMEALKRWERREFANVDYVVKGTNPYTEHYGALMAEVPDADDPATGLNTKFLEMLAEADVVAVAGEALSHCVRSTVDQIVENIGESHLGKFVILTDCSSPVPQVGNGPDFPALTAAWLGDMRSRGVHLMKADKFLA